MIFLKVQDFRRSANAAWIWACGHDVLQTMVVLERKDDLLEWFGVPSFMDSPTCIIWIFVQKGTVASGMMKHDVNPYPQMEMSPHQGFIMTKHQRVHW